MTRQPFHSLVQGYVYFARFPAHECDGPIVKIGFSGAPGLRVRELASECGQPVELTAIMAGSPIDEASIHRLFRPRRVDGGCRCMNPRQPYGRELFRLSDDVRAFIAEHAVPATNDTVAAAALLAERRFSPDVRTKWTWTLHRMACLARERRMRAQ